MTLRQVAWFSVAYFALVASAIWFDLAVLCQGNAKFDGGCGGVGFYIPLWAIFLSPLPIAVILLEQWRKSGPPPTKRLLAYLLGILIITEIGFLLIEKFPILLVTQAAAIAVAAIMRWRAIQQPSGPSPVA